MKKERNNEMATLVTILTKMVGSIFLMVTALTLSACPSETGPLDVAPETGPPEIAPEDVYRHKSAYDGTGVARDLKIESTDEASWSITGTSGNSSCPSVIPLRGGGGVFYPDSLGARNIEIAIGDLGYTQYAGLKFMEPVTINIWNNGVVELDRAGVLATDQDDSEWISQKVKITGRAAIVMVRARE